MKKLQVLIYETSIDVTAILWSQWQLFVLIQLLEKDCQAFS